MSVRNRSARAAMTWEGMMRVVPLMLAAIAVNGCPSRSAPQQQESASNVARVAQDPDSVRVATLLVHLASGYDRDGVSGAFDPALGGHWDPDTIVSFVAASGLIMYDVNTDSLVTVGSTELRRQIVSREGPAYVRLVHVGYLYAQPRPAYRRLRVQPVADIAMAVVGDGWYRMDFLRDDRGVLHLRKLEYFRLQIE